MKQFQDYTPNQAVDELKRRFNIIVGKYQLHSILRMKNIIDQNRNVIDIGKYGRYFYTKPGTYIWAKLFTTEDGLRLLGKHLPELLQEYHSMKNKRGKKKQMNCCVDI